MGRTWKDTKSNKAIKKPHKKERRDAEKFDEDLRIARSGYFPLDPRNGNKTWVPGTKLRIEE